MNYYELLQVREDASDEVIKMAYKALAKKYHPDTYKGDKAFADMKMKEINVAYSVLSDATKRQKYDFFLKQKNFSHEQSVNDSKTEQKKSEETKKSIKPMLKWIAVTAVIIASVFALIISLSSTSIEKTKDSVVMIKVYDENDNEIATGSGFCAFESNYIVTNYHVIEGASKITFVTDNEKEYPLNSVLIFNKAQDIAILKGNFELKPIDIGNGDKLKAGDKVTAIGSPEGEKNTVSTGVISNADDDYQIRITAPISPGSSGGVLLNEKNKVIGITYAIYDSESAQNLNYAINVNCLETMYNAFINKNYTSISANNYESYIDEFFENGDSESVYYNIPTITMFEVFTNPFYKIEKALEVPEKAPLSTPGGWAAVHFASEHHWKRLFDKLSYSEKTLATEIYNELLVAEFDNSNIAKDIDSWTTAEFFINLNILNKAEYAVVAVIVTKDEGEKEWDTIGEIPVDYAVKLLLADLLGGYEWEEYSDTAKNTIFNFFNNCSWEDITDMGAVLECLGYEVEYTGEDSLYAQW